jgi:hypothetical protein
MIWGPGVTHKVEANQEAYLCTGYWIHAYEHPLLAVLMAPVHVVDFKNMIMWLARGSGAFKSDGTKCGVSELTTLRRQKMPEVTTAQRVRFGILCAKEVCKGVAWNAWADKWLSGKDRTAASAASASAAFAANASAAFAANASASASASAYAANASAAFAANASASASASAYVSSYDYAFYTPAYAANAANAKPGMDFVAIAKKAMREEKP